MNSVPSDRLNLPGFPIRKSTNQRLFAAPRGLSQLITPFIACSCQGIHHELYLCLTPTILHVPLRRQASSLRHRNGVYTPLNALACSVCDTNPMLLVADDQRHSRVAPCSADDLSIMSKERRPLCTGRCGVSRIRTDDLLLAKQVLYQLSYNPA